MKKTNLFSYSKSNFLAVETMLISWFVFDNDILLITDSYSFSGILYDYGYTIAISLDRSLPVTLFMVFNGRPTISNFSLALNLVK